MTSEINYNSNDITKVNSINFDGNINVDFSNEWLSYNYMEQVKTGIKDVLTTLNEIKTSYARYDDVNNQIANIKIPDIVKMSSSNS